MSESLGISFRFYPDNNRVPGVWTEFNNSNANTGSINAKTLIIASKTTAGTMPSGVPYLFSSKSDIQGAGGLGSLVSYMAQRYRNLDLFGELWILPLADDAAAVAASGAVAITGTATAAGSMPLYIAGQQVFCAVNIGDTATVVAANLLAALNTQPDLPVSGTAATGTLTVTAKNKGLTGNDIDLRLAYIGAPYEVVPAGLTVAITPMASGATNPSNALVTALATILGTTPYDFVISAYNYPACLNAIQNYFSDSAGAWSWSQEEFGGAFAGFNGTPSAAVTLGTSRNDQHMCILPILNTPTPSFGIAADLGAAAAISLRANPAVPLNGLQLNVLAPPVQSRFNISMRQTLLYSGMSTYRVDNGGNVTTERLVTTYQTNPQGAPDNSYLDVETLYTLMVGARTLRTALQSQYANKILVSDGSRIPPGSSMTTAQLISLSAIAQYNGLCQQGLFQNAALFAKQVAYQNAGNGLVKLYLPMMVANQLRNVALLIAFSKP